MVTYDGQHVPTCYATCSIGHSQDHDLPAKLKAISEAGFEAIELSMPDILSYGQKLSGNEIDPKDYGMLKQIGMNIRRLCEQHHLHILMLQPFANFEGWPKDSDERKDAFERAEGWSLVMEAAGTDMLQVGSSDAPNIEGDHEYLAADLAELADILAKKNQCIAYENWCWATHAPDWKDVWDIVRKANRPNLGLCLDTFQSAGGEWADPTTESGLVEKDGTTADVEERWKQSLQDLAATVPADKIFLLQVSDAYKMTPPIANEIDKDGLRPRGQWSHDYRPLPYDGGYLPVEDFTRAVLGTGFRGWFSMEVFDGQGPQKYTSMELYTTKAMEALNTLVNNCCKDK